MRERDSELMKTVTTATWTVTRDGDARAADSGGFGLERARLGRRQNWDLLRDLGHNLVRLRRRRTSPSAEHPEAGALRRRRDGALDLGSPHSARQGPPPASLHEQDACGLHARPARLGAGGERAEAPVLPSETLRPGHAVLLVAAGACLRMTSAAVSSAAGGAERVHEHLLAK